MRFRWLGLVLVSCAEGNVISASSIDILAPTHVTFPRTTVGFPAVTRVAVVNRSRVTVTVALSTQGPFSVEPSTALSAGEERSLEVTFEPVAAGVHVGTLWVNEHRVELEGSAVLPLDCQPTSACRSSTYDPTSGACVEAPLTDGTACTDTCLDSGSCLAGACVGTAKRCDDGNACTSDACAPGQGCTHTTTECPAPANPCLAAVCDAETGCGTAPVVDGTACGAVSCVTANVCIAGQCRAVEPPDGFRCAPETACRAEGVCRQRQCVQPAPHAIAPTWTYQSPPGHELWFEGVSDALGNWYWVECAQLPTKPIPRQLTCVVVSRTQDGLERFRAPLRAVSTLRFDGRRHQLIVGDRFVFGTGTTVIAVSTTTGAEVWRRDVGAVLALAADAQGGLFVARGAFGEDAPAEDIDEAREAVWLSKWSLETGEERFTTNLSGLAFHGLVLDARGRAFVGQVGEQFRCLGAPCAEIRTRARLSRIGADGGIDFSVFVRNTRRASGPLLALGSTVVLDDDSVIDAETGAERLAPSPNGLGLVGVATSTAHHRVATQPAVYAWPTTLLERTDEHARQVLTPNIAEQLLPALFLTAQNDLVVVGHEAPTTKVRLLSSAGQERWTCEVSPLFPDHVLGDGAGFNGRFLLLDTGCPSCNIERPTTLNAFDLTALGLPATGWVGPRGSPGGTGRAR